MKKALVVIDVQNDFISGTLRCEGANEIIDKINKQIIDGNYDCIIGTQDWHPENHKSFWQNNDADAFSVKKINEGTKYEADQVMWPAHCVQNTWGAEFPETLDSEKFNIVLRKGMNSLVDSYSACFDNNKLKDVGLIDILANFDKVDICGIATDVCVKFTIEDLLANAEAQYQIKILGYCCAGVTKENHEKTLKEFRDRNIQVA